MVTPKKGSFVLYNLTYVFVKNINISTLMTWLLMVSRKSNRRLGNVEDDISFLHMGLIQSDMGHP